MLKPVIDKLVEVIGGILQKVKPALDGFRDCVTNVMKAILSPIQTVIDKFKSLFDWVGSVGEKVGGFLNKINPFKTVEGNVGVNYGYENTPNVAAFRDIALSGQYYNARVAADSGINQIIRATNGVAAQTQKSINDSFNFDNLGDVIANAIQNAIAQSLNIQVDTIIDGRQVAKATAKYMDSEINTINKRKARYGGNL